MIAAAGTWTRERRGLRLLMTADAAGGVWHHAGTLADALARRGHTVRLAVVGSAEDEPTLHHAGVSWTSIDAPLEWMEGGVEAATDVAAWIRAEAKRCAADVVHLNQMAYAPWIDRPTLVAVHSDVRTWHHIVTGVAAPEDRWGAYGRAVGAGLAAADAVVAPSVYQAGHVARHWGSALERLHVIWNGVASRRVTDGEPWPAGGDGDARLRVAAVGRAWDPAKGVQTLDRALAGLDGRVHACHAGALDGPGGARVTLERLHTLGPCASVRVLGLLEHADVFAGPSRYEPFGLAAVEAALAGCALLLSDIGSYRELWAGAAWLLPPDAPERWAEALAALAQEPRRRAALSAAARERAQRCFGAARMAAEYEALYHRILAQHRRSGRPAARPAAGVTPTGGA